MKYEASFVMERIEDYLQVFQKICKPDSKEYHYYFAFAIAMSLYDIPDLLTLDELIKTFIQHAPYPTLEQQ